MSVVIGSGDTQPLLAFKKFKLCGVGTQKILGASPYAHALALTVHLVRLSLPNISYLSNISRIQF